MRKSAFCICENKDADQLRGNREADQRLCFRYTDNKIPLLPKFESTQNIGFMEILSLNYRLISSNRHIINEPRHEKTGFLHMRKTKTQISFAVTAKLISTFVFATQIVQSLYFLNPNFQASSYLVWLYSPVCVGPGRKP